MSDYASELQSRDEQDHRYDCPICGQAECECNVFVHSEELIADLVLESLLQECKKCKEG